MTTPEIIEKMHKTVLDDRPLKVREIAEAAGMSSQKAHHILRVDPGGPVVIILASGSEVRGLNSGRCRWIFSERKNPEHDSLRKGSKAVRPVS